MGKQFQEPELILAQEVCGVHINSSPPCGQELPEQILPGVVVLSGLGITKCHGYKGK